MEVSGEFLSLIASAVITEGASLLKDFTSFLGGVQKVVFSAKLTGEEYKVLACTYQNYLIDNQAGGYFDHGKIVLREIDFTEKFMQFRVYPCTDLQAVRIRLNYTEIEAIVQTSKIREDGADYQRFQKLINKKADKTFAEAGTFFGAPNTPEDDITPVV